MKPLFVSLMVTGILVSAVALTREHRTQSEMRNPVWILKGIDHSLSAKQQESGAVYQSSSLAIRLNPDDHLTLYRVDHTAVEFFDGQPPSSRDNILRIMVHALQQAPSAPGTRPCLFWNAVAGRTATTRVPVFIIYRSDGQNDDASPESRRIMRQAVLALAQNPYVVKVAIIGAEPENWARIRADFAPLRERLLLSTSTSPNVDEILRAIDDARNHRVEVLDK